MSSTRRPSHQELFDIWLAAIRGDEQAKRDLFATQMRHPGTKTQLAGFAKQRALDAHNKRKELGIKSTKPKSDWQKASATVGKSGVTLVRGGLPSLGKK